MRKITKALTFAVMTSALLTFAKEYQKEPCIKDGQYITPHISFGKPLDGGPLKALFITPINGSRDIWELAQRMSLDHTLFQIQGGTPGKQEAFGAYAGKFWTRLYYDEQLKKLRELLMNNEYEVIVLANVYWSSLPPEIVYLILKKAVDGTGVLMVNAGIEDPMLETLLKENYAGDGFKLFQPIPFSGFIQGEIEKEISPVENIDCAAPYNLTNALTAYYLKKGRFVSLAYPGNGCSWRAWGNRPSLIPCIRVNMRNLHHSDYYYELTAKAMLWASKRTSKVKIESIFPQGHEIRISKNLKLALRLKKNASLRDFKGVLNVELRDAVTGWQTYKTSRKVKLDGDLNDIVIKTYKPLLNDSFVNATLLDSSGKVLDFGSGYARVRPEVSPILSFDKETVKRSEALKIKVEWPQNEKAAEAELILFDSRGRIWEKMILETKPGINEYSVPIDKTRLIVHCLRIEFSRKGKPLASLTKSFTVRHPHDNYYVTVSDEPWDTYHSIRRFERIYEWGADGLRDHKPNLGEAIASAIGGLDMNPGRPHIPGKKTLEPAFVKKIQKVGKENSSIYRHFNQAMYNTTDDCGPYNKFDAASFGDFIKFLKADYHDISKLNVEWGSSFKSFEKIEPDYVKDALKEKRVATWSDYLNFMGKTYIAVQKKYRKAIVSEDNTVAVGCDAVYYQHCLASLYRNVNYIMPYGNTLTYEFGRSMAKGPKPVYSGICMGSYGYYNVSRKGREFLPWHILLSGNNSILFWSLLCGFEKDLVIDNAQLIGWSMDEIARMKLSGAAKLINNSIRDDNGIAILYSEASQRAETSGWPFLKVEKAAVNFQELIEDQGLQYNYISEEDITLDGVLEKGGIKLLVMPAVQAISEKAAMKIEEFVKNGGTVWADQAPGIRNEHGRLIAGKGLLGNLFGVEFEASGPVKSEKEIIFPSVKSKLKCALNVSIRVKAGKPGLLSGKIPLLISNSHGKGKTLLFNFDLSFYGLKPAGSAEYGTVMREEAPALAVKPMFRSFFRKASVKPLEMLVDGKDAVGLEIARFNHNGALMMSLEIKNTDKNNKTMEVQIPLEDEFWVYDFRNKKSYGKTSRIKIDNAAPLDVYVFSLMKNPPAGIELSVPASIAAGENVKFSVKSKIASGPGIVRFMLTNPEGVALRDYQRRVLTEEGNASCKIALPWNTQPGVWTVKAENLLTGKAATKKIRVKEAK